MTILNGHQYGILINAQIMTNKTMAQLFMSKSFIAADRKHGADGYELTSRIILIACDLSWFWYVLSDNASDFVGFRSPFFLCLATSVTLPFDLSDKWAESDVKRRRFSSSFCERNTGLTLMAAIKLITRSHSWNMTQSLIYLDRMHTKSGRLIWMKCISSNDKSWKSQPEIRSNYIIVCMLMCTLLKSISKCDDNNKNKNNFPKLQ